MTIPKPNRLIFAAIALGLALLACQRVASAPGTSLPGSTITVSPPATVSSAMTQPPSASEAHATTVPPAASPSATLALPTPTLSPGLAAALEFYPVRTGNSWIYRFNFANKQSGVSGTALVTDTVVETRHVGQYFAARIQRDAVAQQGKPSGTLWDSPGEFWVVLNETEVLRLPGETLDLAALDSSASVELRLPLPQDNCWLSGPGMRNVLMPANDAPEPPGCRSSKATVTVTVPAGDFYGCFELRENDADGKVALLQQYCSGVGLVMARFVGSGDQPGYSLELSGYLRQ